MKKIIVIEDDERYWSMIKAQTPFLETKISNEALEMFPGSKSDFDILRSAICCRFADGNTQDTIQEATETIEKMLQDFIGKTDHSDVLYIIDYSLFIKNKPEINGIAFYEEFVKEGQVLFLYHQYRKEPGKEILEDFCDVRSGCISLSKDALAFEEILIMMTKRWFVTHVIV